VLGVECRSLQTHAQQAPGGGSSLVDAKVGYFGVKSTKVYRIQMGTKPAKSRLLIGPLAPGVLKCGAAPTPPRRAPSQKGLGSTPRKLLKSAPRADQSCYSGAVSGRGRVKSAKVRPQAASHKKVFAPQKKVFAPRADQSC